jgi:hypothetical protein
MSITNPYDCEAFLVILFLNAESIRPAVRHHHLVEVAMNEKNVCRRKLYTN